MNGEHCSPVTTPSSSSLKDKLKSCFRCHDDQLSPRAWIKSDLDLRDRCRGLIGWRGKNRRRHTSADFSYDPTSYSLNFEDQNPNPAPSDDDEELPLHSFMARLPATPERISPVEQWAKVRASAPVSASRTALLAWS